MDEVKKVLHSFASLGRGGIETWLMNIIRLELQTIQFDFFLTTRGGAYEEEAISYGCAIHDAPPMRRLGEHLDCLTEVLASGRYDALHVHGEEFLGDAVMAAARAGVPVRVVHCHGTALARGKRNFEMLLRKMRFLTLERRRIMRYATDIVACSSDAGRFLVGGDWEKDSRCRPLYCGIALAPFYAAAGQMSRDAFRRQHGIPEDAIVVGHVGSMGPSPVKNHPFLLEIFQELAARNPNYVLFLAGDGPLRPEIERTLAAMGLRDRVFMPGVCDNVAQLMVHGFDVFVLPSLHEGLPVVGIEAIAAGLYPLCSDTITRDFTDAFPDRVSALPLSLPAINWADHIERAVHRRCATAAGCGIVEKSLFSIETSAANLVSLYRGGAAQKGEIAEEGKKV